MRRLGIAAAAIALVAVPAALAAPPTVTETQIDRTRTLAASPDTCPFPIVVHSSGTRRDTVYSNGRVVTILPDFKVTYSNPASGKSLTSVLAGPQKVEPNPDGTVTVTVNGNDGLFTAPHVGFLFGDVGHLVYIASPDDLGTPLAIVQSTGHQDPSPFPAVCGPLS
jgi:hypothetical protein